MSAFLQRFRSTFRLFGRWSALSAIGLRGPSLGSPLGAQVVPGEGSHVGSLAADRARVAEITGQATGLRSDSVSAPGVQAILPTVRLHWNSGLPNGGDDAGACPPTPSALLIALAGMLALSDGVGAQVVPGEGSGIGSLGAERLRLRQITGVPPDSVVPDNARPELRSVPPTARLSWSSILPGDGNDGRMWAGRGLSGSVSLGGVYSRRIARRMVTFRFEPEVVYSQNRPIQTLPGREPGRSAFSSPWHTGDMSADLPLRFGDRPMYALGLGQSSITANSAHVTFGAATTTEWWGPAIRNTLLLSNNAGGVPRLFARTARPVRTRFGTFEGRAFVGALTESPFFDSIPGNDTRSLNGLLVTYRPALDSGLTLGLSRLVVAPVSVGPEVLAHFLDVLLFYEPVRTGSDPQNTDQLFSLFARWVFPESGFETYAEWSRTELPRSLREYLEVPHSTQGYTIGLQWAKPVRQTELFRVQGEVTYLEQTQVIPDRPTRDYYTGRAAVQGFTQRGQVLGASIGPGSSSQFVGLDWLTSAWQVGAFAGRTRTENDALYRQGGARPTQHDVTLYAGMRGGYRHQVSDVAWTLTVGRRYNYLLQSLYYIGFPVVASDFRNVTFTMHVTPR